MSRAKPDYDPTRIYSPDEELLIPQKTTESITSGPNLKPVNINQWKYARQCARRNLLFLCTEILGYKDVSLKVYAHDRMICAMQQFAGGVDKFDKVTLDEGAGYEPAVPMWDLWSPSPERRTLVLASRGFLKSSICTVAHSIQWIINYPAVRILFSSGTGAQVSRFISIVIQHFRYNEVFRFLFPEFVPHGKEVKNFGSTEAMTIRHSIRKVILGEPTISTISVGMVISGPHQDVHKHDDVVDKENVRTITGLEQVTSHLQHTAPLLDRRKGIPGWTDFIGTRYHYSDPYGLILDAERVKPKEKRIYAIVFAPAWTGRWGTDEVKPTWEDRLPIHALKAIEEDPLQGPDVLATQYGLRPRPGASGLVESRDQIVFVPRSILTREFVSTLRKHITVDLHGMAPPTQKGADNDYTAITTAGFAADGHCYVLRIFHGRPTPFEVIEQLFSLWSDFPDLVDIKIPRDMLGRMLLPFLQREQMRRQRFLPIVDMPIDNRVSKPQKIRGLQPWFRAGIISFADDIPCKQPLIDEILRFPKFHDDILDTIRDQMENRNAGVEASATQVLLPMQAQRQIALGMPKRFVGFESGTGREIWESETDKIDENVDTITGMR